MTTRKFLNAQFDTFIKLIMEQFITNEREAGYADCKKDMQDDLEAVVAMLDGDTDRKKISNYIKEYLLHKKD